MTDQEKIRALRDLVAPPSHAIKAHNRKHQDAIINHNRVTARMFLSQWIDESPIQHISSAWIRKLFKQANCLQLLEG